MASVVPMRALRVLRASRTPPGHAATTSAVGFPCWAAVAVRYASSTSSSSSQPVATTTAATSTTITTTTAAPVLAHNAANPPETTRPPPLHLPVRGPDSSALSHLMASGKAYLAFYKTGLRYLYANWKLVRALSPATSSDIGTRSDLLLRRRWSHDLRRLPLFAVLLLVCGECTPLVVIAFPHVVPYPCRIPRQVDKLQRLAEKRRHAAFGDPHASSPVLIARSLGLVSPLWDRLGWIPDSITRSATTRRLRFLAQDDALLRQSGGVPALEPAEIVLACIDRGLDVRGLSDDHLRQLLAAWLHHTASSDPGFDQRIALLTKRPNEWPEVE
ncbi:letm1-like protein [Grosmannia clavigera kw1407]|uniref:Letm1-like protein n=1 Tax=Grosmannia clavigera (strain kw1407 / UAMH 11150) TaxID=655863 RepID=F0XNB9_GROCL|nr:letm1-like protein [Grosmannia clavigera kw1407]EFX00915.1 letm1-like protein [Grosmannia clavigera kw1407]